VREVARTLGAICRQLDQPQLGSLDDARVRLPNGNVHDGVSVLCWAIRI